jgi:hypothetical protein
MFLLNRARLIEDHRTFAVTIKRKDLPGLATISSTGKLFRSLVERTGAKVRTAAGRARCKNLPKPVGTVSTGRRLPSGHNVPERTGTTGNVGRIRRRKSTDPT